MYLGENDRSFGDPPATTAESSHPEERDSFDGRLAHILRSATQVIAKIGYEKASMRQVAKAAGTSLAGMYHYFDSKERMLFLIQFRTFNSLLMTVREQIHGIADPSQQLRVMIRTHVHYFVTNMAALKVCSHELESLSGEAFDEVLRIRREYYGVVRAIVDGVLTGRAPTSTLDRHVATMSLFGTLNWLYRWYDPKRDRSYATVANQIAEQFLHGILGALPSAMAADSKELGLDAAQS